MHIRKVEFLLTLSLEDFIILLTVIGITFLHLAPDKILLRGKHDRRSNPSIPEPITNHISVERIIILHLILHVIRALQVERTLVKVAEGNRLGALHRPTGVQQTVRNRILIRKNWLCCDSILRSCPVLCSSSIP